MLPCEDPIDGPRDNLPGFFASADRFCTWLGVCPCNRISGGRILGSATRKTSNRLAEPLRLAAFGLKRAKCRPGEYCRRMKGRLGKAECITATAHKLARVIYAMIASGCGYDAAEACLRNPSVEQKRLKTPSSKAWAPTSFNPASYNEFVRRTDPIDASC